MNAPSPAIGHMPFSDHRNCAEWHRESIPGRTEFSGDWIFSARGAERDAPLSSFAARKPRSNPGPECNFNRPARPRKPGEAMTDYGLERPVRQKVKA